jgi:hypothetical protein
MAKFTFTVPSGAVRLRDFCSSSSDRKNYNVAVRINNSPVMSFGQCDHHSTDAGGEGWGEIPTGTGDQGLRPGQVVEATVRLTDEKGRSVSSAPGVRFGLGVYKPGPKRVVDGGPGSTDVSLDEWKESGGHLYKLTEVRSMEATRAAKAPGKGFSIPTPADVPFLISSGTSDLGGREVVVNLTGPFLPGSEFGRSSSRQTEGVGTESFPAMAAGVARLKIEEGKPTKGKLVVAVYTLQE